MNNQAKELADLLRKPYSKGNQTVVGEKIRDFLSKNSDQSQEDAATCQGLLFRDYSAEFDRQIYIINNYGGLGIDFLYQNKLFFLAWLIIAGKAEKKEFFLMDTTLYPALCASAIVFYDEHKSIETNTFKTFKNTGVNAPYVIFDVREETVEKKKLSGSDNLVYSELILISLLGKSFFLKEDKIYFPGNMFVSIHKKDQGFSTDFPQINDLPENLNIVFGKRAIR